MRVFIKGMIQRFLLGFNIGALLGITACIIYLVYRS